MSWSNYLIKIKIFSHDRNRCFFPRDLVSWYSKYIQLQWHVILSLFENVKRIVKLQWMSKYWRFCCLIILNYPSALLLAIVSLISAFVNLFPIFINYPQWLNIYPLCWWRKQKLALYQCTKRTHYWKNYTQIEQLFSHKTLSCMNWISIF